MMNTVLKLKSKILSLKSGLFKSGMLCASCLVFFSCGKAIKDSGSSNEDNNVTLTPGANAINLELAFDGNGADERATFLFDRDARVKLPQQIVVESGSPQNFIVRVHFNTQNTQLNSTNFQEMYCDYQNIKQIGDVANPSEDGYFHRFKGCYSDPDEDGEVDHLNFQPGQIVVQDEGNYISLEFINGFTNSETTVSAEIVVDRWF